MFYLLLFLGVIIRLVLIPVPGFKADVAFWKGWGLAVADKGILWLVNNTNYNYPPGFAYVLWLINKIYALFKNPYNINEYWADNNVFYLFLIKLITIAADLVVIWVIIKIAKVILGRSGATTPESNNDSGQARMTKQMLKQVQYDNLGKILALFYFLNPAVIYDGVVWGQVDQLGLALFLLSIYFVLKNKASLGAAVFTISALMKFQNIIFIPLFYLFIFRRFWTSQNDIGTGFKELSKSLAVTFLTFIIVVLPFFWGKQMEKLIWLLTVNSDWFPWYSLNAFNGWWIASGLKGMQLVDKHLVFGIISAKQFGLYLFIFAYFIGTVTVLAAKKEPDFAKASSGENLLRNFILACTLAVFAFFHLLTQSHERYLFPVMGLLPLIGIYWSNKSDGSNWKKKSIILFSTFYLLLSTFFFLNMYLSMGWNYPDQVIPTFTREQTLGMSLWISIFQIILFAIFFVWYFRIVLMKQIGLIRLIGVIGLLLIISLWLKNADYFLGKPVSLTKLRPVGFRQDYLEPVTNKTVESARGLKFWNRLSVNYYFYDQGIGSHADSEITYHLGRKFSKFTSDFGIDTEADQAAKVYFSLIGDGRELYKSEIKGRFDQPGTTTVDVRRVNYLTLKISKAGESNFGAHADWLNPRLTR